MKYTLTLGIALLANWLLWSGHFESTFLIGLGVLSCLASLALSRRMNIVDEEGAPIQLGLRPFTLYAPWLIKEIFVSNIQVAAIILSSKMPLRRTVVMAESSQKTALGRVIMANSITLTPGTVTIDLYDDSMLIHALSIDEAEQDVSGEIDTRVCKLEKS